MGPHPVNRHVVVAAAAVVLTSIVTVQPENAEFAYVLHGDIWLTNTSGDYNVRVTSDGDNFSPAWSPDGNRLLFHHGNITARDGSSLRDIEARIVSVPDLVQRVTIPSACCGAWSPNGLELAVFSYGSYAFETLESDGSGREILCCDNYLGTAPYDPPTSTMAWTNDDLLYSPASLLGYLNVWDMARGTRSVISTPNIPSMSPGAGVCFSDIDFDRSHERIATTVQLSSDVDFPCSSPVEHSQVAVLTSEGTWLDLGPGKDPSWSPDGEWLLIESGGLCPGAAGGNLDCPEGIYALSLAESRAHLLIEGGTDPAWRPNSDSPIEPEPKTEQCGEWAANFGVPDDRRIVFTEIHKSVEPISECRGVFELRNDTDVLLGIGGYTFEISDQSNNSTITWSPPPLEGPILTGVFLVPSLPVDVQLAPEDIKSGASVSVFGELNLESVAIDLSLFLLRTGLALTGDGPSCVVPEESLAYAAIRSSNVLYRSVELLLEGDTEGAIDEFDRIFDRFIEDAKEALASAGVDCGAERILGAAAGKGKIVIAYVGWVVTELWDYLLIYEQRAPWIQITYVPR